MLPTLAAVAAALDEEPATEHRAVLEALALALLRVQLLRREGAQLAVLLCRSTQSASAPVSRGDRDAAAA